MSFWRASRTIFLCVGLLTAGCSVEKSPEPHQKAGWTSWKDGSLLYRYSEDSKVTFFATCNSQYPAFAIMDEDYVGKAKTFTLVIDDRRWEIDRWLYDVHGGPTMMLDDAKFGDLLANARSIVSFRAEPGWDRSFKPTPKLAAFVANCRAKIKAANDADRVPASNEQLRKHPRSP
jgi:hypothetical protein